MKLISTLLLMCAVTGAAAAPIIEKPVNTSNPVAFAIITDNATYEATAGAMHNYRDAVEADGLSTYIVRDNWQSPTEVREALKDLYAKVPALEGIVIVGDVPVAMVRNGQHMTTAFKMDEDKYPFIDSSVPSDRYYDCLDLEFRYLKQDEENPHLHYYELSEDCVQTLNPTFYSARIRYPKLRGGDKYKAIGDFLNKAAKAKADMKGDKLDTVVSFNGHGYNSDCLIMWMDEEKAYRENFPLAFDNSKSFKHWNFRMNHPMRYILFNELLRPDVDVFMFHEHGAPDTQYINGNAPADSEKARFEALRGELYYFIKRAIKRGKDPKEFIESLKKEYNLTDSFFDKLNDPEIARLDSIDNHDARIYAEDFHDRKTMPRFVMFDACYNGSFHEDDYIAGEYIFNDGGTLAAQGNTRNVLQDRWTIEMIGLLSHGVRAGQYNRLVATLEGHLSGDPTMRFAPTSDATSGLSADMTLHKGDKAYWESLLDSPYADVRSLAMRMLADADTNGSFSNKLLEIYKTSPFNVTRMEAIKLLSRYNNADFIEAVSLGVNDPYELVARKCADYAGNIGDPVLLPAVINAYIDGNERQRVHYTLGNSLNLFPLDKVKEETVKYYSNCNRFKADEEKEAVLKNFERMHKWADGNNKEISDTTLTDAKRISSIRFVRNNPFHYNLDKYFEIIENPENSEAVRVNMAEALGWFDNSYRRQEIIAFCKKMIAAEGTPTPLAAELRQTLNRIK